MRKLIALLLFSLSWIQLFGWLLLLWIIRHAESLTTAEAWTFAIMTALAGLLALFGLQRLADKIEEGGKR